MLSNLNTLRPVDFFFITSFVHLVSIIASKLNNKVGGLVVLGMGCSQYMSKVLKIEMEIKRRVIFHFILWVWADYRVNSYILNSKIS